MKKKLIAGALLIIIASSLITGFLSIGFITQHLVDNSSEKLTSYGYLIHKILNGKESENIDFAKLAKELEEEIKVNITFFNESGKYIVSSKNIDNSPEALLNTKELETAFKGQKTVEIIKDKINNKTYISVIMPVIKVNNHDIILKMESTSDYLSRITQIVIRNIGIAISIGIFTTVIIAYGYSTSILKPIEQVTVAAKHIAKGNYNKKLIIKTGDEIEDMANTFNYMAGTIESNINMLNDKNAKLNAIMIGMVDGIIAFDCSGNILIANCLAKEILELNYEDLDGMNIFGLVENSSILNLIQMCLEEKTHPSQEMTFTSKPGSIYKIKTSTFHCDETSITKGIVLVMEDITEIRKSEILKRDFIINASHELKTPLTTISGFIETLKLGNYKDESQKKRFISIIESETNRLKRLTESMLNLAVVENMYDNDKDNFDRISLEETFLKIKDIIGFLAENKNIALHFVVPEEAEIVVINKDWFKQLFINLIDNAIKYTPNGGEVELYCELKDHETIFTVSDTGIGISEEELPRIFDKFYRVDKSRASVVEGTGLGLAIVEHIAKVLKGQIAVESELGKGSKFIVSLPIIANT